MADVTNLEGQGGAAGGSRAAPGAAPLATCCDATATTPAVAPGPGPGAEAAGAAASANPGADAGVAPAAGRQLRGSSCPSGGLVSAPPTAAEAGVAAPLSQGLVNVPGSGRDSVCQAHGEAPGVGHSQQEGKRAAPAPMRAEAVGHANGSKVQGTRPGIDADQDPGADLVSRDPLKAGAEQWTLQGQLLGSFRAAAEQLPGRVGASASEPPLRLLQPRGAILRGAGEGDGGSSPWPPFPVPLTGFAGDDGRTGGVPAAVVGGMTSLSACMCMADDSSSSPKAYPPSQSAAAAGGAGRPL